jgi:hypothetical protein
LTKKVREIYQNSISKEFFFLTPNQLKRYNYSPIRKAIFNSFCQKIPIYIKEGVCSRQIGQRIRFEYNTIILRQETRVLLEAERFFPWKPGSILPFYTPILIKRGRVSKTRDITSGIPQIETLLEIRSQTGLPSFLKKLYKNLSKQGLSNGLANRKAIHFRQRTLVDSVQRIYITNGVTLDDKHLELLIRPIAFAQVIEDNSQDASLIQGEKHPLEIFERANYVRVVKNWKRKELLHKWEPRILYSPLLFGLTKSALHSTSFLSAASFQETSRVLSRAALAGRIDLLFGLKENLILGTRLPIGTSARFFRFNNSGYTIVPIEFPKEIAIKKIYIIERKKLLLWLDALYYLEIDVTSDDIDTILYEE